MFEGETQGATSDTTVTDAVVDNAVTPDAQADVEVNDAEGADTPEKNIADENKTLKKALNKKNRYTDNLRSRLRALEAEHEKLKQTVTKKDAPKMDDFESVIEYMQENQKHLVESKFTEQEHSQKLSQIEQQKAYVRQQQDAAIHQTMQELLTSSPEAKSVLVESNAIIEQMPQHIVDLMYEIDNAPLATYALAKEGRLQDLYYMNPYVAAAEIVQAQQRGQQYLSEAQTVTTARPAVQAQTPQAPAPIGSVKGAGKTSKALKDMNADEIVKRFIK